jgi:tetratricopeptide (TPR) repeat protein
LDYPEEPLAYALLGSAYYNTGQSETAVTQLRKCLSLNPDQADAYEVLARVAYEKGELEETVRLCREALKRGSASPDLRCRLGRALMDLGRAEEAIRELQSAAKLPRPGSEAFYLLGQAQLQAARYADAKSSFQRAVALMPDHTQAFFGLYTTCLRLGLAAEAEPYRRQFVELEAADRRCLVDRNSREDTLSGLPLVRQTVARTLFGAGQVYRVRNQKDKAAELLRKAAVLDGDNSTYRSALEAYYAQSKALAEGLAVFEQMAAEQPENSLNQLFVGRMRARMRQLDAAERAFLKVQEMAPAQPEGYRALAELYIRAGVKPVAAVASARRAVELEPSGVHYFTLSVACLGNKDRQGAIKAIQRAVDLDPKDAEYRDLLRQLQSEP